MVLEASAESQRKVKLQYSIMEISVRVETLDLARHWPAIHHDLMNLPN